MAEKGGGGNKASENVVTEIKADGVWLRVGDRRVGPFNNVNEIDLESVAEALNVTQKDVLKAKLKAYRVIEEASPTKEPVELVVLPHLNMIEDPDLAGKPVVVEAVVSSTSVAYLAPAEIEVIYKDKEGEDSFTLTVDAKDPINIKLVGVNEDTKYNRLKRFFAQGKKVVEIIEKLHRTVYLVRVRPPVFTLEKRGEKIVDERGFEYKAFDIYITSDQPIAFQPSSRIRLEGICVPNPKTQKTTLLAYKVEFPEDTCYYDVEKLKRLKQKFEGHTIIERVDWILRNFAAYSQIVGRENLAFAGFLCFFTPTWIKFNGQVQRGWGNVMFLGDTTTAKTETIRKLIRLLKAGTLITAETASAVGLTGTTTQIEKQGWFVDWGFLVLCDRKLLAVDGAQKLNLANWAALAEAERSGVVTISKAAKSTAYARTRQIKIANPVDREAGRYKTRRLTSFLYPCQALTTVLDKTSIARVDLAVFSGSSDVKAEQVNVRFKDEYDEDLEILSEALKWCWSNHANATFTEEAVEALLYHATQLYNEFFCDLVPLTPIDLKWKLARLSAALAYLTLSTDDFRSVTVTKDHVQKIVNFIRLEYAKAGLNTLAKETKFEVLSPEDVQMTIYKITTEVGVDEEVAKQIIKFIVLQGRVTRDQIKTKFGLAENKQLRPLLALLSNDQLIKSGRGLYPTPKLIQAYKILLSLSRLTSLTTPKKDSPPQQKNGLLNWTNEQQKSETLNIHSKEKGEKKLGGESSPEIVKLDNLDKTQSLKNIKDVTWDDSFWGRHECAFCGYEKWTSWKALLKDGREAWICEDCQREWDRVKKSSVTEKSCERCGKPATTTIMREDGVHYLCSDCLDDWEGNL